MEKISELRQLVEEISQQVGRKSPPEIIAVSKTVDIERVAAAYQMGLRHFAESRVQELVVKADALKDRCPDLIWHFVGNLQSNKLKKLVEVPQLQFIHSVDSLKNLKILLQETRRPISLFWQVNTSDEVQKHGAKCYEDIRALTATLSTSNSPYLQLQGLMTIGKIRTHDFTQDAKNCFRRLISIREQHFLDFPQFKLQLSMGMSSDYALAIEMGTDYLRIGSAIFGER